MLKNVDLSPMLNAYPDSMGGTLGQIVHWLKNPALEGSFGAFYILPSVFHSDLDRGFSIVDYGINEELAKKEDIQALQEMGIRLKLDFILNHISVNSPQFKDLLAKGEQSEYKDFFINWNAFWEGHGQMTEEGYIQPDPELIKNMFFRKPGLPILMLEFPDGRKIPYWNTFYQNVTVDENGKKSYLGQMDLNIRSQKVWEYYDQVLQTLADYGAAIVRLDAFAYAPKAVGERNFMNEPGTWDLLEQVRQIAEPKGLTLLPEIHASYGEGTYRIIGEKGYMVYDFFLPGLVIDAIEKKHSKYLAAWGQEILDRDITTVNMLGCHDGIPMLDLKGLLPEEEIQELIDLMVQRGGFVKDLHGAKNMYYQVNATYFSALGDDERKMLLSRAIQLMMPGKPQVWYLDLFAGKNDHEAVRLAGPGGHKEINRTNLKNEDIEAKLEDPLVKKQIEMLRFRKESPAFSPEAQIMISAPAPDKLSICWATEDAAASLEADFSDCSFRLLGTEKGSCVFQMQQ